MWRPRISSLASQVSVSASNRARSVCERADRLIDQVEQRLAGHRALPAPPGPGLIDSFIRSTRIAAIRCSLVGKLRNSVPRPDPGLLGDLADADVEPPLAEHLGRGVEQPAPVALGVGTQGPAGPSSIAAGLCHSGVSH